VEAHSSRLLALPQGCDDHEALFEAGLTDGLPVVAPTPRRVEGMLAAGSWEPHAVLLHESRLGLDVTAHQAAVCAVLAGVPPPCFPVVGAAVEAIGDRDFVLYGPMTSTGGAAIMIIVSGPVARRIGVHGGEGLFGPGFRPNATIGRAVRLVLMHCLLAIPGRLDRSTQGWPGKFTLCFGENADASPWPPLHVSRGHHETDSVVTVFACESGHTVVNHATATAVPLLSTFADAMAALGSFSPGRSVVVFSPEHASKLAGMTRETVQQYLYEHSARELAALKHCGKIEHDAVAATDWSGRWLPIGDSTFAPGDKAILVRRGWSADDILLLVGGGSAGGHSMFFPSWSRGRGVPPITRKVHA
jgi:hypothetical protein